MYPNNFIISIKTLVDKFYKNNKRYTIADDFIQEMSDNHFSAKKIFIFFLFFRINLFAFCVLLIGIHISLANNLVAKHRNNAV